MSPEVLDESIEHASTFERYCKSDVYSLGLVMWEVLRRTRVRLPSMAEEAQFAHEQPRFALPYFGDVTAGSFGAK